VKLSFTDADCNMGGRDAMFVKGITLEAANKRLQEMLHELKAQVREEMLAEQNQLQNKHAGSSFDEYMLKEHEEMAKKLAEYEKMLAEAPIVRGYIHEDGYILMDSDIGEGNGTHIARLVDIKKLGEEK